jgi:hypothetical protein
MCIINQLTVSRGCFLLSFLFLLPTLLYSQQKAPWQHLSSQTGDLPVPWTSTEQTSAMIADIDKDGVNDFVLSCRKAARPHGAKMKHPVLQRKFRNH